MHKTKTDEQQIYVDTIVCNCTVMASHYMFRKQDVNIIKCQLFLFLLQTNNAQANKVDK